jgi:catechol 2,3-dioxygenase-like lactoylglutathione lyase family enzyme
MPADAFGRALRGVGINLLVSDVDPAVAFLRDVMGLIPVYADPDFAVLTLGDQPVLLHADHTYDSHPLSGFVTGLDGRGAGVELRLYGVDPDAAEARARAAGHVILAGALDKPHGLREAYVLDPDGYCWVPCVALPPAD